MAARIRLFCVPHAGGGSSVFARWHRHLPPTVEVCAFQLPGRQERLFEAPFDDSDALVAAMADAVQDLVDRPFAIFGHSMGALMGFELARSLAAFGRAPARLFVAAHAAPGAHRRVGPLHTLDNDELIRELRKLRLSPLGYLDQADLLELMLPTIRADLTVTESYSLVPGPPLPCPITTFAGLDDEHVRPGDMEDWRRFTSGNFESRIVAGGHFFVHSSPEPILAEIDHALAAHAARG